MTELPEPLTPADCELQDFAFMPLDVSRLRDSELASNQTPEACWAAVLLWCASWHQVPAASIPNDDMWIATQARYAIRGKIDRDWANVREGALRGWIECADGRLYHPVVAEKAIAAWDSKLEQRWKSECARIKKHNQRHGTKIGTMDFDEWTASGRPQGQPLSVPRDKSDDFRDNHGDMHSKREGEGQGQREGQLTTKPKSADTSISPGEANLTPDDDLKSKDRNVQVAVLLRSLGIRPMTSLNVFAIEWARNTAITDELLTQAVAKARKSNGATHISPNYLNPIIAELLNPKDDMTWRKSDQGTDAKGRELGVMPKPNETYPQYRERISDEIRRRKGGDPTEGGIAA